MITTNMDEQQNIIIYRTADGRASVALYAKKTRAPKKDDAPKIENVAASTTLGDIDVLAQLKAQMEKGE